MFTLIQGLLHKDRLRDVVRNFIYMPDSSKQDMKSCVATLSIMQREPCIIASRKHNDQKVMGRVGRTLEPQVAVRVLQCFFLRDYL